ncbi:MAG: SAM-dependent methyltransferase [Acidobacteria bacterium]|nr:MAG: SAM-dependent methyltransferase [Acidobacteriota bacterium]
MALTPHTSWPLSWIGRWHYAFVFQRRARVLAELLAAQIPQRASVLDVGCGDGTIGSLIARLRPDIFIQGVELQLRPGCRIPCKAFDGEKLPFDEASFDVCLFVDVLHHTQDPTILLREAVRVGRCFVLIKDHLAENFLDHLTLRFMDWIGNRPHGVVLTYNYQSREQWKQSFLACGLTEVSWTADVPLYPAPFSLLFGRGLHFVSLLMKNI